MSTIEKTVYACQTFVIVVPTWLAVALALMATITVGLSLVDAYYQSKIRRATRASHGGGQT